MEKKEVNLLFWIMAAFDLSISDQDNPIEFYGFAPLNDQILSKVNILEQFSDYSTSKYQMFGCKIPSIDYLKLLDL